MSQEVLLFKVRSYLTLLISRTKSSHSNRNPCDLENSKISGLPAAKTRSCTKHSNFCVTWWALSTSSSSFVLADIKEKDSTILQACNGMITSDIKPVMCAVQKSIVFIYLLQCSQAVWVSVQERLAGHVPEKEKRNRECGFLWERDKHVRMEITAPHRRAFGEEEA